MTPIGKGFLMLLKMLILPYMAISLVYGIGQLSPSTAKSLLMRSLYYLLASSGLILLVIYACTLLFSATTTPPLPITMTQQPPPVVQFLNLFIPDNLVRAFTAENIPAIVMISLLLGIALMQVEKKENLLPQLDVLIQLFGGVMRITSYTFPLGIFALSAELAGSVTLEELSKLRLYLVAYFTGTSLLAFVLLPRLTYHLTGIKPLLLLKTMRETLIVSWLTGNLLVAIPYMIANAKQLLQGENSESQERSLLPETLVPIFYSFPSAGNLFSLLFIFFSAYYYSYMLDVREQIALILLGFPAVSGATSVVLQANAFLLDYLQLPIDAHSLFAAIMPVTRGMQVLLSAVGITTLTLTVLATRPGRVIRVPLFLLQELSLCAVLFFPVLLTSIYFPPDVQPSSLPYDQIAMQYHAEEQDNLFGEQTVLKIGYRDALPYCFYDSLGSLAGMEVQLIRLWAQSQKVSLQWVPLSAQEIHQALIELPAESEKKFELLIGALPYQEGSSLLPVVYHFDPICFVVKDHLRKKYSLLENLAHTPLQEPAISFDHTQLPLGHWLSEKLAITWASSSSFQEPPQYQIPPPILWTLTSARAWSLSHPSYIAIQPFPHLGFQPLAFYCASPNLQQSLSGWLKLQKATGALENLLQPWTNPKAPKKNPRWALLHDLIPLLAVYRSDLH
jgi:Na+/H+-dicarboxylate symporter